MLFKFEVSNLKGWTYCVTRENKLGALGEGHAHQLILTDTIRTMISTKAHRE